MDTGKKRFAVKLNNNDKIEQLLQEIYDKTNQVYQQVQNQITDMENTTILKDLDIDGKDKYGKIMKNYFDLLQKANAQKHEVAKLMTEVIKHNGNVKEGIDAMQAAGPTSIDLNKLRQLAKDAASADSEVYETKK